MNLPKETVAKHVKIFEDCFRGKGASRQIDNFIGNLFNCLLDIGYFMVDYYFHISFSSELRAKVDTFRQ